MMEIVVIVLVSAAALAAILVPLLRGRGAADDGGRANDRLDADVARYRAALRTGTVCGRCRQANPEGSRYCAECGREL